MNQSAEELIDKFVRHYSSIHVARELSFEDRLKFDVYKRETKEERFKAICKAQQKKLPKDIIEDTFRRLISDSVRRKSIQERLKIVSESQRKKGKHAKRMSLPESNKIYGRMIEKWKERKECLLEKSKLEDYKKEQSIIEQEKQQKIREKEYLKKHKKIKIVSRMSEDIKMRKERIQEKFQEKVDKEIEECEKYFIPKINNFKIKSHNLSVYERMVKDVNLRKVKEFEIKEMNTKSKKSLPLGEDNLDVTLKISNSSIRIPEKPIRKKVDQDNSPDKTQELCLKEINNEGFSNLLKKDEIVKPPEHRVKIIKKCKEKNKGVYIPDSKAEKLVDQLYKKSKT